MSLTRLPDPDQGVLARSKEIVADLEKLIGADAVISDEEGRRTFEADALVAYRRVPLVVVLPRTTEQVSKVLKYCNDNRIKVVPRGAGTSLCGGALPAEDAVVIGISRMNRVLDADFVNRTITVETGITNLAVTEAVSAEGFFYAPDPSSQLACTLGGNLAMNSGGAHCLKYGVTTNNVLGVRIVLMNGEIVEIGGPQLDAEGYDLLALVVGSRSRRPTPRPDIRSTSRRC
jgi:glycolate oxidase